jgi:ATP-dependent Zn protease
MNPRLWRTAIHEAAHAVVARMNSIPITTVTIIPSEGSAGQCAICLNPYIDGYAIAVLAGREAELEFLGSAAGIAGTDRELIALAARCRDNFSEPRLRRQARRLVRKHRAAIGRVAKALLMRKTLSRDEVDALIAG